MKSSPTVRLTVVFLTFLAVVTGLLLGAPPAAAQQEIQVTSADPPAAEQGTVNLTVTIKGKGFKKGAQAEFLVSGTTNPGGIQVNSTTFVNPNELRANIDVADEAVIAKFDIVVYASGRSGKGTELFSVVAKGQSSCTDPTLQVIFAPGFVNGGVARLYGDRDFGSTASTYYNSNDPQFNGGTIYTHGEEGVYASLQVCNGTDDFILNLGVAKKRLVNFDFAESLTAPDPNAIDVRGKTLGEGFLNFNQIANDALYVNGQLDTCMGSTLYFGWPRGSPAHVLFRNPALFEGTPSTVDGCHNNDLRTSVANQGGDTAIIHVQRVDDCTWIIEPVAGPTWHRAGLVESAKRVGEVSGGQYNMPFAIKLIKLGCQ